MSSYGGGVKSLTFFLTDRLFLCSGDSFIANADIIGLIL